MVFESRQFHHDLKIPTISWTSKNHATTPPASLTTISQINLDKKLQRKPNTDGLINCLRQPGQFCTPPLNLHWLSADARGVMVFAIKTISS
jgi:hypothetical protein